MHATIVKGSWVVALSLLAVGCVKRSAYDAKEAELNTCASGYAKSQESLADTVARAGALGMQATQYKQQLAERTEKANQDLGEIQKQLDDSIALVAGLKTELQRTGADVDKLVKERGAMAASLDQARKRLEELRKSEAAAERRAESLRGLVQRFQRMADAGRLKVVVRRGRMVLVLPNDVLFDSGKADIKPTGKQTLVEVAKILADMRDRQFQVAGHTDSNPIQTQRFPSNWYLSSARAIQVVEQLTAAGMSPQTLSATGYGEHDPIASNDTDDQRARNRRIEITVQPNVDELISVGDLPK